MIEEGQDERFRNPDYNKICDLLATFSKEYKHRFSCRVKHDSSEAEALRSIIENRHSLAHEGTNKLNLSVKDMGDYYQRVTLILEALEDILC